MKIDIPYLTNYLDQAVPKMRKAKYSDYVAIALDYSALANLIEKQVSEHLSQHGLTCRAFFEHDHLGLRIMKAPIGQKRNT